MANVADNEERYLRQILLLGKGGCLVLRGLVNRETAKDGRSLEDILRSSKPKLQKYLLKFQFNYLFPSSTDVNTDIETWDLSLLISIILNVFGHVTQEEKDAIIEIREIRNNIQGHHASYSLEEGEYNGLRLELCENILKLSSDKTTNMKCFDIISYSGAGRLTSSFILKELNALHAFEEEQLSFLNEHFGEAKSKLESIDEKLNEVKADVNAVIGNQHEHKVKLTKNVQGLHVTALSTQADVAGIKDKLNTSERIDRDRHEELAGHLQRIHTSTDETKQDVKEIKDNADKMEINQQDRHEKLDTQLQVINAGVQSSQQALTEIKDESTDHKQMTRDVGALQSHMHGDLLDMKSLAEENNRMATASSKTLDVVKETVSSSRVLNVQQHEILRRMERLLTEFILCNRGGSPQQDVDTNININSDNPKPATEAQDIIVNSINDILKEIRPGTMVDRDNAEVIMQRVNTLIAHYGGIGFELTKALLDLIKDIIRHGHIQQARKGSIKLTVRFTSYIGLYNFMRYVNDGEIQDRLNDISRALKNRTGHAVTLSANIAEESLYGLIKHLEEEWKPVKCNRSVVLPVKCKDIIDLVYIWKLLQMGGADKHMKRLSEILTKLVGEKVTLTTSVDLEQLRTQLFITEHYLGRSKIFEQHKLALRGDKEHYQERHELALNHAKVLLWGELKMFEDHQLALRHFKDRPVMRWSTESLPLGKELRTYRSHAQSEGKQDDTRRLGFRYSVRCGMDSFTPFINGIELLPNGRILLTDWMNRNLKMLDSSFNVVSYCDLPDRPSEVRYIGNDTAAVGLRWKGILFARISNDIVIDRLLEQGIRVCSLASYGKTLFICDITGTVYTATTDGHLQGVLYKSQGIGRFIEYNRIAISDDGKIIYLAFDDKGLVKIDNMGRYLSTLKSDKLRCPCSVCVVDDGTIFVLDKLSKNVLQVDYGGTKVLDAVGSLPRSEYYAMCYDRKHSRLIVGGRNEDIQVFELKK